MIRIQKKEVDNRDKNKKILLSTYEKKLKSLYFTQTLEKYI